MADDSTTNSQEAIEAELSVGKFAGQQVRTTALTVGGLLAGVGLGFVAAKTPMRGKLQEWIGKGAKYFVKKQQPGQVDLIAMAAEGLTALEHKPEYLIMATGGLIGTSVGSTASLYEHWAEVQGQRERIKQINKDVSSVMASRAKFEGTLENQHTIIQKILAERQKAPDDAQHGKDVIERRETKSTEAEGRQ